MLLKKEYLLLPMREVVVFPECITVLTVSRKSSLINVEKAFLNNEKIMCVAQKEKITEDIKDEGDIFSIGTLCEIHQKVSLMDGDTRVFVKGIEKMKIDKVFKKDGISLACSVKTIKYDKIHEDKEKLEQIKSIVFNKAELFLRAKIQAPFDFIPLMRKMDKDADLVYILTNVLNININAKQSILEEDSLINRYLKINEYLELEKTLLDTEREINDKIDKQFQKHQKDFFLKEKLKIIKNELKGSDVDKNGDIDENDKSDAATLKKKAKTLSLSEEAKEKVFEEINKLDDTPTFSPEYSTIKNFVQWILDLPWGKMTQLKNSLKEAEEVLNKQHYGLDDIKERIIEFIAVMKNKKELSGPIICLVGAPGVGKTSLAKSIAEATNRNYVKISLGGVRDEAEIRGHRKTYVGAMPGKIIQAIKKSKSGNPLILLDEIDKMNSDLRGDPTSALLEVLDPEQNKSFHDHFLEIEYDLSNAIFIATANNVHDIPYPLRDRMEIIKLSGYTEDEKVEIAKHYLIPRQLEKHNLKEETVSFDNQILREIIRKYTFEAGVRNLEREIETIIRKTTRKVVEDPSIKKVNLNKNNLKDFLGVEKYSFNANDKIDKIGVATGLAYTEMGGDLLYLEVLKFDGSGKLNTTGKLGEVMKESVQAAFSYVRSRAGERGVTSKVFNKFDFHVHVPEGATPKDGPSAGVAISVALMSCLLDLKVRSDTAMTGEITLTGKVLAIGGLKEKLLAALRGNIKNVLIPFDNIKDLEKIPSKVKKKIKIVPIKTTEEAFKFLLINYDKTNKKGKENEN
ncbi:MAG: endopeptidase La [Rickettsiales bacterium]|jgi:ATP-dependent Lon protease|nr:endopeptidase La [Rickettsiales bacterium]